LPPPLLISISAAAAAADLYSQYGLKTNQMWSERTHKELIRKENRANKMID
jgi:hypothetical protein